MSLPVIQPRVFYGLTNGIKGNANYVAENEILYPAGGVLVKHHYGQNQQHYIKLHEKQRPINIICVCQVKNVAAVAEVGEKPIITIWDLEKLRRMKILGANLETVAEEFVSLSFSFNGKYLAAVLGDPDWTTVYFNWEKAKTDSTIKPSNIPGSGVGTIVQVACNPNDTSVLVIVGPQIFRLMSASEKIWRQYGWSKTENLNFTTVTWLTLDRVMAGTNDGRLILIDGGELKAIYRATGLMEFDIKLLDEPPSISATAIDLTEEEILSRPELQVRELITFPKGFAFGCESGQVHLFEKITTTKYAKRNLFAVPEPEFPNNKLNLIHNLSISPDQERLLATTMRSQIYSVKLWSGVDMSQSPVIEFQMVGQQLHHGPVVGLSVCKWKPLFMTCGQEDCTVRVWNYETEKLELVRQYQDQIHSVAIHPTGLYTVIGFTDKLRYMMLLLDDIQPMREFSIRACSNVCFSDSGHKFAAVNGNIIQLYCSSSFVNTHNLKGHNGKVRDMVWTKRDNKMVSCGTDGAIYEWDIATGTRINEIITKETIYTGVVTINSGEISYGTGTDCCITEVNESTVTNLMKVGEVQLDCIVLSRSNLMMFLADANGNVLSVTYPPKEPFSLKPYRMHNCTLTKMILTNDDLNLITCSTDGTVCIWKLTFTEGKTVKIDKEFKYSEQVLIAKMDLVEKQNMIRDLIVRIKELETEHSYQMQKSAEKHAEKVKEVHEGYIAAMEELKEKNEQMETDHTTEINAINAEIAKMKTSHTQAMTDMEANFTQKLIIEYDKYQALESRTNRMREDYERKLEELGKKREMDLSDVTTNYETLLRERDVQIQELHVAAEHRTQEHESIKQQIEDDADREIVDLKTQYENQLHEEQEINLKLRGETGVMKKKFLSSQKDIEEYKHQIFTMQQEQQKFQQIILGLERDISDLKKEIVERDSTIQEKEKRISDLKHKNQELDKFKFVLNFKITELKNQIEPKDREIKQKKEQIQEMELELENMQKVNTSLDLQLVELREKLNATHNELIAEHEQNRSKEALLRRIRFDLHHVSGLIQEPKKLKDTVKHLYHKYSQDSDFVESRVEDTDAQSEFMRQREHLERTVASLKKQVYKESGGKQEVYKIMEENATLIIEINRLRKELKSANKHVNDMESILGLNKLTINPKEAKAKLQTAVQSHQQIHDMYQTKIKDMENVVSALKDEVRRLVRKLNNEEMED